MDFLVEMEICYPPDTDPELLAEQSKHERARTAEISSSRNFFKNVWIVPCERARILICSATDAADLHATFASLPVFKWAKLQATPLVECDVGSSICMPNGG